ncbi:phage related integrase [hydrothermal vent metagenome]|uniref:Phage related integrase n=1 Tax=hydrothermal vent metagenome TaxID=652676 RepID=A0A1W1DES7_9ZZZZ
MGNFTSKMLDELPTPTNRKEYFDDSVKGLTLRVTTTGIKTFSVMKRVNGKMIRTTLGRYPTLTVKQARAKAINILNIINDGINPNKQSIEHELKKITLKQVLDDYITSRGTNLKVDTVNNYRGAFNGYLKDWGEKELLSISRDMVEKRHRKITKQSPTRANTVMRLVRALFNYAMGEYEDADGNPIVLHNPTQRLSHIKAWNREKRKQTIIKSYDLKTWWDAVHALPTHELNAKKPNHSETARDYFIFVLLTGLRRREASTLTWSDIDFKDNTLNIEDTKNHESHALPLTDYLVKLLRQRKANTDSIFVFEGNDPTKPMNDPKKQLAKAREISKLYFNIHDLRRTFITIAESLGVPKYALKQLINHKDARDVTAGYIIMDVERLRQPMNDITDYILEQVK